MKTPFFYLFLLLFLFQQSCFGQEISFVNGPPLAGDYLLYDWKVINKTEKELTLLENRALYPGTPADIFLKKINRNTLQVVSEKLLFTLKEGTYSGFYRVGETLVLFYKVWEKPMTKMFYKKFDLQGAPLGEPILVSNGTYEINAKTRDNNGKYFFFQQDDKSLVMALHNLESETTESLSYTFFDNKLNAVKSGKFTISTKSKKTKINQIITDYKENFYYIESDGDIDISNMQRTYTYEPVYFVRANTTSTKVSFQPLDFDGAKIWDIRIALTSTNEMIGIGLYSDEVKMKEPSAKGALVLKYNPSTEKLEVKDKKRLPDEVVEKLEGEKAVKNDKGIGNKYLTRTVVEDKTNNGYIVGFERFYNFLSDGTNYSRIGGLMLCFLDKDLRISTFYTHQRVAYPPMISFNNWTEPQYRVFFKDGTKCILAGDDRFATNKSSEPVGIFGTSALTFSKENKLLSSKNLLYEKDEKNRFFYLHPAYATALSDDEYMYYADLYLDKFANTYRPKDFLKKYVKVGFK